MLFDPALRLVGRPNCPETGRVGWAKSSQQPYPARQSIQYAPRGCFALATLGVVCVEQSKGLKANCRAEVD